MKTKTFILLTLIAMFVFVACSKTTPAGFWKSFDNNFLVKNISDQGPYSGHRAMFWQVDKTNTLNSNDFIQFAHKNGWTLVDSLEFNADQTSKWTYNNKAVFPLTSVGFSDKILNGTELKHFPLWFGGQLKVFKFKTSWITIQPGTDNSIEENGFVVLNSDKTKMAVYHLWGE